MLMISNWLRTHVHASHLLFLTLVFLGIFYPEATQAQLEEVTHFFALYFDWLILLATTGFLLFCTMLAFSRYGAIRLGKANEEPQFSTLSWLAMLFAAGMGTGLVFYGAAEPLFHMTSPPPTAADGAAGLPDALAAKRAMATTLLHWGFHAWVIYGLCALTIAYFSFRHDKPMLPSTPLACLWPNSKLKPLWQIVDMLAVAAIVFGLVASLAQGVEQMDRGLLFLNVAESTATSTTLLILLALTICYIASALTGLGKGIKILSDINMITCILLMVFLLALGPTHFVLETFVTSLGDYVSGFIRMGLNLRHYSGNEAWMQTWTIASLLWWIAWGPFVGIFIARISRGRTIKEFILGVMLVPTLFSCLWFSVLGGAAIYYDMFQHAGLGQLASHDLPAVTFALLEQLPAQGATSAVTVFLIFIFLVTSADSGSFVLGMLSSHGNPTPHALQKLFWGLIIAAFTAGLVLSGKGLAFIRTVAMSGAMPYLLIMIVQAYALWVFLKCEPLSVEN